MTVAEIAGREMRDSSRPERGHMQRGAQTTELAAATGATTAVLAGSITLAQWHTIAGIVAMVVGTVATLVTLYWRSKEHRRRMRGE